MINRCRSHLAKLSLVVLTSLCAFTTSNVLAQAFPNKPVRLIVTYPPGGSSDLMGRLMAKKLSELWGQPVIVENKGGAAGSIGMDFAARQAPDGYSFVLGNFGPALVNPLMSKVSYNMEKDFIPISLTASGPNVLVVPANSPYKSLQELLDAAKAKPNALNFGTSGPGSMSHIATEMIMRQSGVQMTNVPYKGGGLALVDLMAGQIDFIVSDALPAAEHIKSGKLRPLAITSGSRTPLVPGVPTFSEGGLPGFVALTWWGVFLPAATPKDIQDKYYTSLVKVMGDPEIKERFAAMGVQAQATTPEEFKAYLAAENARYSKLIVENKIKAD
ncbi:tripartite tricarboxylate transporter substrate binding protein [Polynucleobacter sp. UK-Mo-2m-Kol15]|uniref:Bug family tripartite tricarboxylate transporter substrate binding protein n=1 Tax=Polynucleobacter sp. UK-Mo-2m-Kol15 TaxID=2576916 RepID=UPI001C0E37C5|nr:tripartite tricarboxylate transporter substrate binding protein [Polynucleobacter sp. UK-Mo-2m-Kol15]MBU3574965.1 tripartite tricarboxylate transporter substrate binding protein [Polynucleobacter sp. UK-Mo-2m-Kol15]